MTLNEVSTQLYNLTRGHVNGECFTKKQLNNAIQMWMRFSDNNAIKNRYVITITLRDSEWPATINQYNDSTDGFDYWIPETMDEAKAFWNRFLSVA